MAKTKAAAKSEDTTKLLGHWHSDEKLPFHDNRWMCLGYSERAMALLDDFAWLDITLLKARNLQALSMSNSLEPPSAPYASVLLDDVEVFRTQASTRPLGESPAWSHQGSVPFLSPLSMVRLQVKDRDRFSHEEDIGFVEFCLGDLPWDSGVEGWLELRLQDKFENTSWLRYAEHKKAADGQASAAGTRKRGSSLLSCGVCKRQPLFQDDMNTAGEVFVKLRLRLYGGCTRLDRTCALALDCPYPEDYGRSLHRSHTLPGYKIQDIGDNLTDLRHNVVENALFSALYVCQYVLQWRSLALSLLVTAVVVGMWYDPDWAWVLVPGMMAAMVLLFACEALRLEMTTGGFNAPLSQEGFERVALWRSTPAMARFLRRLVEEDLQGKVVEEKRFQAAAAHCFSAGRPRVSFKELRGFLTSADFTSHCQEEIGAGAKVLASGRRATVKRMDGGRVVVEYEDDRGRSCAVERPNVVLRQRLPEIPEWALSTRLGVQIRTVQFLTGQLNQVLGKVFRAVGDILAWRRPAWSALAILLLLAVSVTNALVFWNERGSCRDGAPCSPLLQRAAGLGREVRGWLELSLCLLFMVFQALWFSAVRNVLKIALRLLALRRSAPACWAFHRPGFETDGLKAGP